MPTHHRSSSSVRWACTVLAVSPLLIACGDDDSSTAQGTGGAGAGASGGSGAAADGGGGSSSDGGAGGEGGAGGAGGEGGAGGAFGACLALCGKLEENQCAIDASHPCAAGGDTETSCAMLVETWTEAGCLDVFEALYECDFAAEQECNAPVQVCESEQMAAARCLNG